MITTTTKELLQKFQVVENFHILNTNQMSSHSFSSKIVFDGFNSRINVVVICPFASIFSFLFIYIFMRFVFVSFPFSLSPSY